MKRSIKRPPTHENISATSAQADLCRLIDSAVVDREPVPISGKRGNVVLVFEADWRAIQDTLHLLSVPGMRESIHEGFAETAKDCSREIDF